MAYRKKFNEGFRAGQFDAFWHREYNPSNDVPVLRPVVNVEAYEEGYAAGFGSQTLTGEFSPIPFSWEYHHGQCIVDISRKGAVKYRHQHKVRVKSFLKKANGVWTLRAQYGMHSSGWLQFSSENDELKRLHLPEDCRPDIYFPEGRQWHYGDNDLTDHCPICKQPWYMIPPGLERDAHLLKHLGIKNAHQS